MKFKFKIKKLIKQNSENRRFRKWIDDETNDSSLVFYSDEINFSTMIFKGALQINKITLTKKDLKVVADVEFSRWSNYFLLGLNVVSIILFIINIPLNQLPQGLLFYIMMVVIIFIISYPIIRNDIEYCLIYKPK